MRDVALVGLPGSGKSTVFSAVSKHATAGAVGSQAVVEVPDERLERIAAIYGSAKITHGQVRLVDVAGIDPHSLGAARAADALAIVLRAFGPDADVRRDHASFHAELAVADLATIEKVLERAAKKARVGGDAQASLELESAQRAEAALHAGRWLADEDWTSEQRRVVSMWTPLTLKPVVHVVNADDPEVSTDGVPPPSVVLCAALEVEASELGDEGAAVLAELGITESASRVFIRAAYDAIGLLTFFTAGETEARAWEAPLGSKAPQAAGVIHSDFERGFIKAERLRYHDLLEVGSEDAARQRGLVRMEGKEYEVQEGDILVIRHAT